MTDTQFKELIDHQVCHVGDGEPDASLGKDFDLYIDRQKNRFYRKVGEVWTSAPKEVIGQCLFYLNKTDLSAEVEEILVPIKDATISFSVAAANSAQAAAASFNNMAMLWESISGDSTLAEKALLTLEDASKAVGAIETAQELAKGELQTIKQYAIEDLANQGNIEKSNLLEIKNEVNNIKNSVTAKDKEFRNFAEIAQSAVESAKKFAQDAADQAVETAEGLAGNTSVQILTEINKAVGSQGVLGAASEAVAKELEKIATDGQVAIQKLLLNAEDNVQGIIDEVIAGGKADISNIASSKIAEVQTAIDNIEFTVQDVLDDAQLIAQGYLKDSQILVSGSIEDLENMKATVTNPDDLVKINKRLAELKSLKGYLDGCRDAESLADEKAQQALQAAADAARSAELAEEYANPDGIGQIAGETVNLHDISPSAHAAGFNHRLPATRVFDYSTLPNSDFIQKGHLEQRIGDVLGGSGNSLASHAEQIANADELGHVKVDGTTLQITADGTLKAFSGKSIGEIFAYPSTEPPAGAYILNGQTIANCKNLYPEFYNWLERNSGDNATEPIYKAWSMPSLTANGTVGFADYAVEASSSVVSGYEVYESFDGINGGNGTYCSLSGVTSGYITFYSPYRIRFSSIKFKNASAGTVNQRIVSFSIYVSNTNSNWKLLKSGTIDSTANSAEQEIVIPLGLYDVENVGYQYLKIQATNGGGSNTAFPEITLYGDEFIGLNQNVDSKIYVTDKATWNSIKAENGVVGAFAIEGNDVTLPFVVGATLWGAESGGIGKGIPAGLPNITGEGRGVGADNSYLGAFDSEVYSSSGAGGYSGSNSHLFSFDASRSNPIYGNSDTVQPRAMAVSWCIQVYNTASPLSTQDSSYLASQMQNKAQLDLANVVSSVDFVVDSWNDDNGNWYRKYRSGWCEQGGRIEQTSSNTWLTVTFMVEMQDTNYFPAKMPISNSSAETTVRAIAAYNLTTISMEMFVVSVSLYTHWKISGYAK